MINITLISNINCGMNFEMLGEVIEILSSNYRQAVYAHELVYSESNLCLNCWNFGDSYEVILELGSDGEKLLTSFSPFLSYHKPAESSIRWPLGCQEISAA